MPTVEANGVDLYYERRGDGPPVIFLHGMGLDHRYWPAVTEPLTGDYEVIVLDMRLHGRSGGDSEAELSIDTYADDLHALVDELGFETPAIVGHSMGGMVALRYADQYPDALSALVTLGSETPDTPTRRAWLYDRIVFPVHYWLRDALGQSASDRFMFAVNWLARDDAGLSDLGEFERIRSDHHENYPEPTDAEVAAIEAAIDDYAGIDYESISAAVLAMYGEHELAVTGDHARYLAERIPNGQVIEIPDAAHVSIVDNPEFVIETIEEVLDEQVRTETASVEAGE